MEHIEEAGVHSGDSACSLPPYSLPQPVVDEIKQATYALARELQVRGLMNIQFAVKIVDGPHGLRARSEPARQPHVAVRFQGDGPAAGKIAAKIMAGVSLAEQGISDEIWPQHTSVKESVFPFSQFPGVDIMLGPEMRSTGEVMGIDEKFAARLRQEPDRGRHLAADGGDRLHQHDPRPQAR